MKNAFFNFSLKKALKKIEIESNGKIEFFSIYLYILIVKFSIEIYLKFKHFKYIFCSCNVFLV